MSHLPLSGMAGRAGGDGQGEPHLRGIPGERIVLGLLLAASGPPVLIALFMVAVLLADPKNLDMMAFFGSFAVIFYGTIIGALHALIVGLPLYALLLLWLPHRWWLATLNGFVAGAAPWAIMHVSSGRDGNRFEISLALGAFGAIGGFLFWWVTRKPRTVTEDASPAEQS